MKTEGFQKADGFEPCREAILLVWAIGDFRSTIRFRSQKIYKTEDIEDTVNSLFNHNIKIRYP